MSKAMRYGGIKRYVQNCRRRRIEQERLDREAAERVANPLFRYRVYSPATATLAAMVQTHIEAPNDESASAQVAAMFPGRNYFAKRIDN